jgi:hypothetical protein
MFLDFCSGARRLFFVHACLLLITAGSFSVASHAHGDRGYSRYYDSCEGCGRWSRANSGRFYYGTGRAQPRRYPPKGQGWWWNGRNSFYKGSRFYSGPAFRPGWRRW